MLLLSLLVSVHSVSGWLWGFVIIIVIFYVFKANTRGKFDENGAINFDEIATETAVYIEGLPKLIISGDINESIDIEISYIAKSG